MIQAQCLFAVSLAVSIISTSCGNDSTVANTRSFTDRGPKSATHSPMVVPRLTFDFPNVPVGTANSPTAGMTLEELEALDTAEIREGNGPPPEPSDGADPADTLQAEVGADVILTGVAPSASITLTLYDVAGRHVYEKKLASSQGTMTSFRWAPNQATTDLPSGIYFLRVTAGGRSSTKRITIIR